MALKAEEKALIQEFVLWLAQQCSAEGTVDDWPDEKNRAEEACDALATIGGRRVAIEHTSLDSFLGHRTDDARFMEMMAPLEESLSDRLPGPGYYTISIPVDVIPTGRDWTVFRKKIERWAVEHAPGLKLGSPSTAPHHVITGRPEGVPFEVTLARWPREPGKTVSVTRFAPADLEEQRREVIRAALEKRGCKVARYREKGYAAILLCETRDIALANHVLIASAMKEVLGSFPSQQLPDDIYLADTGKGKTFFHTLEVGELLFPLAKPSLFPNR